MLSKVESVDCDVIFTINCKEIISIKITQGAPILTMKVVAKVRRRLVRRLVGENSIVKRTFQPIDTKYTNIDTYCKFIRIRSKEPLGAVSSIPGVNYSFDSKENAHKVIERIISKRKRLQLLIV